MNVDNNIPEGWLETNMGEVVDLAQGVAINKKTDYVLCDKSKGVPLLKINNLLNNTVDQYVDLELVPQKTILKKDDVIFTRTGQVGWVFTNKFGVLHNNSFKVIPNDTLDKKFLYWFLKQKSIYNYVQKVASGSAQPDLNHGAFKTIEILLPCNIEEQKAIAKILTTIDDKIENLQAQNKTLETTAQTIFKEWFGKYQIGDNLPKGWRFADLEEITEHIKINIKPFDNPEKEYLHYSLPSFDDGLEPKVDKGSTIKSNKYSVIDNSFLVSKLNPFTPRIWTIHNSVDSAICSTEFQVVKPKKKQLFPLIHCILNSKYFTSELSQKLQGTSSSHQRVKPQDIFDVRVIIPNDSTLTEFDSLVSPLILKKNINHIEIQTLKKTRDTLLPKLMSGSLRVNDFK